MTAIQDAFTRTSIDSWNLDDLRADPTRVGSAGSCTWVEEIDSRNATEDLRLY